MQCVSDLAKLRASVFGRVQTLRQIVAPIAIPLSGEDRRALAFVTIEIDNLIIVGLRQYTKSCLMGARTAVGHRIITSLAARTQEEAAALIFSSLNPAGYVRLRSPPTIDEKNEIVFRDPKRAEKVLADYRASNLPDFQLAVSLNALAFAEVKTCRHFFSHRMRNTSEAVKTLANNTGVLNFEDAEHFLVLGRPTTGIRFVDGWLSDVHNFFELAA